MNSINRPILFTVILVVLLSSCGPGSDNQTYRNLSDQEQVKFEKYMILGKQIYNKNCVSCHQKSGQGLRGIIPPLANSDYLENNQATIPCLLLNTTKDTIIVNGKSYLPGMPAHQLTNLELAEVVTFINNTWGNEYGYVSVKDLDKLLSECQ